jgi:hypothetical protein
VHAYTYCWSLRPGSGLTLELHVTAPNVVIARRELRRFLFDHDGSGWTVECVSREVARIPHVPLALPPAGH